MLAKFIWFIISIVAAFSLSVVVGIINPSEKINALWLVVAAGCFFVSSSRFYASFLAAKVLAIDKTRITWTDSFLLPFLLQSCCLGTASITYK